MVAIKTWSMDGTFKIIPHWYQHLFTIHAIAPESRDELPKPEVLKIKLPEECEARMNREPKHNDAMFARGKCRAIAVERWGTWRSIVDQTLLVSHSNDECTLKRPIKTATRTKYPKFSFALVADPTQNVSPITNGLKSWELERLSSLGSDGVRSVKLDNRLYVLDLRSNLISVAKITEKGFKGIFQGNSAIITNQNLGTVMVAHKEDGLYYVESPALIAATAESKVPTLMEWHRRLGHLNERSLIELTKHEKGKQTQSLFSKSQTKRRCGPLELIHTDICGPMRQNSIGGSKYFVTFIDDHSRWCETYFLKNRNEKFLRVNGIRHETSVQYTSQQNGVAERKNRTLLDIARYMLLESKLSFNFWAEAISTACYIRNCCPSRSLNGEIPLTLWNGRKFTLNYFRIFREWAHVLDKSPGKGNFSTRSKECIFIGYSTELKAYRLWCPAERKEWPANDIREMENETLELQLTPNISNDTHQSKDTLVQSEADQVTETRKIKALLKARLVRSGRCSTDPKSVVEALLCHESKEWLEAMKREYDALVKSNTWEIVSRAQKQKRIARLVAKGFQQRPNIDFHETYASVARLSSIRTILAISANYGLTAHQLDFVSAYLNEEIEEEIYMQIPEKFGEVLKCSKVKQNLEGKVCRIRKALYGLKQSGCQWYRKLDEKLSQYGLKATSGDPCVYFERRERELTIAAIYVDDVIIASNNTARLNELKKTLAKSFEMKDMDPIHYCLGIEIKKSANGDIEMSQQKYIMDILERFRMKNSKPVETPIDASNKLSAETYPKAETEKVEMQNMPYRSLVGSLMYLSVSTRPDIAFAVSLLSQLSENYGNQHWAASKRVLPYLKKAASYGLRFQRNSGTLMGFSDADWSRFYTGYVFKFGNAAISWESRKQRTAALSSTEAEYMALSKACKEAMHLKRMVGEITGLCRSVVLHSDNQSALKLARSPVFHARINHIDIWYHFIRETAERKDVEL
ncbi:Retrovirus-related Pol polyprotein from transposon TNT 1-94 [Trichinella pseudospiralis]|uniref:Retrovirus-related Pol polyprotein from transposon TNT 1-94 n=1 Tax=Trichinella pseudospiralis TaxID=6337 RepID=A0A0V1H997_TRIPS|nr:Retrovirus-related Pol polyprotein from transposon TNT 1-94 [Trichinella pseudospiralis]